MPSRQAQSREEKRSGKTTLIHDYMSAIGRRGGIARTKALSPEQRSEIARQAATARWYNTSPETHISPDALQEMPDVRI